MNRTKTSKAIKFQAVKNFWNHSIQRQLILGIALVHAILMTIFVADLVSRQQKFLNQQSIEQTQALARSLAANSVSWVLANDVIGLEEIVLSQKNYPNLAYAMVISPRGKVLSHTDISLVGLYVKDKISLGILQGEPGIRHLVDDTDLLDIAIPIFSDRQLIGWSRVAISQKVLHSSLRKILRDGIGYTILAILVGSLFAIAMARGITKGIRNLLEVTRKVEDGHIEIRVEDERPDELGQLGKAFNHMIHRIEKSMNDLALSEQRALEEVKTLKGIVPICSQCKKIRDDKGYWNLIETYIEQHSEASFSHGMCPECSDELYGREDWYIEMKKAKK